MPSIFGDPPFWRKPSKREKSSSSNTFPESAELEPVPVSRTDLQIETQRNLGAGDQEAALSDALRRGRIKRLNEQTRTPKDFPNASSTFIPEIRISELQKSRHQAQANTLANFEEVGIQDFSGLRYRKRKPISPVELERTAIGSTEIEFKPKVEIAKELKSRLLAAKDKYQFVDAPGRDPRQVAVERVEARSACMAALGNFLSTQVEALKKEVRAARGEESDELTEEQEDELVSDPMFTARLDEIFETHVRGIQKEMQEIDREFDISLALIANPYLLALFGERVYRNEPWPARHIFEAVVAPQISGFEDVFNEEQRAQLRLSRRRYLEACATHEATGEGKKKIELLRREYLFQRQGLEKTLKLKSRNLAPKRREAVENWLRESVVKDAAFLRDVKEYWLTEEKKKRVAPTAGKMQKKKGSMWRRLALVAGAVLGVGVPSSTHRETYEPTYEPTLEKFSTGNVLVEARTRGAIETFRHLLASPEQEPDGERAALLRQSLQAFVRGLGIDADENIETQAAHIAERLGFVAAPDELLRDGDFVERGELLTDADFNREEKNQDPLIYEGSYFEFNPKIGTLIVRMPDGREQILVVENVQVASYKE